MIKRSWVALAKRTIVAIFFSGMKCMQSTWEQERNEAPAKMHRQVLCREASPVLFYGDEGLMTFFFRPLIAPLMKPRLGFINAPHVHKTPLSRAHLRYTFIAAHCIRICWHENSIRFETGTQSSQDILRFESLIGLSSIERRLGTIWRLHRTSENYKFGIVDHRVTRPCLIRRIMRWSI